MDIRILGIYLAASKQRNNKRKVKRYNQDVWDAEKQSFDRAYAIYAMGESSPEGDEFFSRWDELLEMLDPSPEEL